MRDDIFRSLVFIFCLLILTSCTSVPTWRTVQLDDGQVTGELFEKSLEEAKNCGISLDADTLSNFARYDREDPQSSEGLELAQYDVTMLDEYVRTACSLQKAKGVMDDALSSIKHHEEEHSQY